jgi:transcription initiation factor TFIIIB Brf1 subunit/transcription initiation factor TFIIB
MTATEAAILAGPIHVGNADLIASTELARLEDDAAHLRAIIDITRAKSKAEAVAIVAAKTEQLKRAYSTLDHIAKLFRVPSHKVAEAVEAIVKTLSEDYPRCTNCDQWITAGEWHSIPDPSHCGDGLASTVLICDTCNQERGAHAC